MSLVIGKTISTTSYLGNSTTNCNTYINANTTSTPVIQIQKTYYPTDGVVTVASQIGYAGLRFPAYKLNNTNHQQARNSSETKKGLSDLFDAKMNNLNQFMFDPYFKTFVR